jgi:hypothetical protein
MLRLISNVLLSLRFEWQFFQKEMKFKCRTRFASFIDTVDDNSGMNCDRNKSEEYESLIESHMRSSIKFWVSTYKWSKELSDIYVVTFKIIASGTDFILN